MLPDSAIRLPVNATLPTLVALARYSVTSALPYALPEPPIVSVFPLVVSVIAPLLAISNIAFAWLACIFVCPLTVIVPKESPAGTFVKPLASPLNVPLVVILLLLFIGTFMFASVDFSNNVLVSVPAFINLKSISASSDPKVGVVIFVKTFANVLILPALVVVV